MSDILTSLYEKILKNLRENRPSTYDDQRSHASEIRSFLQLEAFPMRRFSKMEGWIIGDQGYFIHTSPSGMAYGHAEQNESGITLCEEMTCSINDPHYKDILQEKSSALSNPTLLKSSSRAKAELSARLNSKHPIKTTPKPATALNTFEKEISGIVARTVMTCSNQLKRIDDICCYLEAASDLLYDACLNQIFLHAAEIKETASLAKLANCTTKCFTTAQVDQVMDLADRFGIMLDDYRPAFPKIRVSAKTESEIEDVSCYIERTRKYRAELIKEFPDKESYIRIRLTELIAEHLGTDRNRHETYGSVDELYYLVQIRTELDKQRSSSVASSDTSLLKEIPTNLPDEPVPEPEPEEEKTETAEKTKIDRARLEADRLASKIKRFSPDKTGH